MPSLALACRLSAVSRASRRPFSPASLFSYGEQGAWYDPSDLSTLYQDAAGTTPVTAVEQPVGRMLDKSGRGNHATQTTTTSRPVLSARVNLLTKTEQFNDPVWVTSGRATIDANNTTAPNETLTADRITETVDNGTHRVSQLAIPSTGNFTFFVNWKKGTRKWVWISVNNTLNSVIQFFDLDNATLGASNTIGAGIVSISAAITPEPNGFFRCSLTVSSAYTSHDIYTGLAETNGINAYSGSTSEYGYIWGASLVPASQASLPYQRVNTLTDYDATGFLTYLRFDGIDDWLVTPSINFARTDKMTVFAGVRRLTSAAVGVIVELSVNRSTNPGAFTVAADGASRYQFNSSGSTGTEFCLTAIRASPNSVVLTGTNSIAGNEIQLRQNGVVESNGDGLNQGTGNYGNYPLYIGHRGGVVNPFSGNLYGLIVRGAATDDAHLTHAEKYLAYKSGVTL